MDLPGKFYRTRCVTYRYIPVVIVIIVIQGRDDDDLYKSLGMHLIASLEFKGMDDMIRKSKKRADNSAEIAAIVAHESLDKGDPSKTKARRPDLNAQKGIIVVTVLAATVFGHLIWKKCAGKPANWWLLLAVVLIPIVLAVSVAASSQTAPHQRLIALAAVSAIFGNLFPKFISVLFVCSGIVWFSLSTRPAQCNKLNKGFYRGQTLTAIAAIAMTISLLLENFCIWVVSATYYPSHKGFPEPLQDNGRLVQNYLLESIMNLNRRDVVQIRALINVQWALVAAAFMSFIVSELQLLKNRTLSGLALRALTTFGTVRMIRTISFLMTVLPSQNPRCYLQHFPLPPEDWVSWILVGMHPQTHGGCNDLIISGHACVTSTLACLATSAAGNTRFSIALWALLIVDFSIEVYEGFHYSVDMWMGGLITSLLWRSFATLEDEAVSGHRELLPLSSATKEEWVLFALPAFIVYIVVVALPEVTYNYFVIGFVIFSGGYVIHKGFSHFIQHVLLCLLFMALAAFL